MSEQAEPVPDQEPTDVEQPGDAPAEVEAQDETPAEGGNDSSGENPGE